MTITLTPHTETLLKEQAGRLGQDTETLTEMLLRTALEEADRDFQQTCQAIADGLADVQAGRTLPYEQVLSEWEADKTSHHRDGAIGHPG